MSKKVSPKKKGDVWSNTEIMNVLNDATTILKGGQGIVMVVYPVKQKVGNENKEGFGASVAVHGMDKIKTCMIVQDVLQIDPQIFDLTKALRSTGIIESKATKLKKK